MLSCTYIAHLLIFLLHSGGEITLSRSNTHQLVLQEGAYISKIDNPCRDKTPANPFSRRSARHAYCTHFYVNLHRQFIDLIAF